MSVYKEYGTKLKEFIEKGKKIQDDATEYLKQDFEKAVKRVREAGESISSLTGKVLDTVWDVVSKTTKDAEVAVSHAADTMMEKLEKLTQENLDEARDKAEKARLKFEKALEKANNKLEDVEVEIKDAYEDAIKELAEKSAETRQELHRFIDAIREFDASRAKELHEDVSKSLKETVEKSRIYLEKTEKETRENINRLLKHTDDKVNAWLDKIRQKIGSSNS